MQYYQNQITGQKLSFNQFVSVKELLNFDISIDRANNAIEN